VTVGFGFAPNLLTLPAWRRQALAGLCFRTYRRWGFPPRPENVTARTIRTAIFWIERDGARGKCGPVMPGRREAQVLAAHPSGRGAARRSSG
jgi:hypothetical protein